MVIARGVHLHSYLPQSPGEGGPLRSNKEDGMGSQNESLLKRALPVIASFSSERSS